MRNLLLISVAALSLSAAMPALAQSSETGKAVVGATAGGAAGGTIGFLLGGPIGAIVGGWAGAVIGGDAAVSEASVRYAGENPVDVVYLEGDLTVGTKVGDDVTIYPIEGDDQYGYIYANNRVYIIDLNERAVVQSPGYLIPNEAVSYAEANPTASVSVSGNLEAGLSLDANVALNDIPDSRTYKYVYINDRPVLVDAGTRTVVWVR